MGDRSPEKIRPQIDTTNAAPGSYSVTVHVTDPKDEEQQRGELLGELHHQAATAEEPANDELHREPVERASRRTALRGRCQSTSPDNVPVSVSNWSASSGLSPEAETPRH